MSGDSKTGKSFMTHYLESLALVEQLHRCCWMLSKMNLSGLG